MGMRINQNIAAVNAYRNLGTTEGQLSKSLEKLSSGFRINRAADDAAGLAISEKLRGQVTGLNTAAANAQNGISLIQTAEGALNESHSILQRMRELAVQSANDTNTDDDRGQIQKEVGHLQEELTRIAKQTQFNGKELLDGSFAGKLQIGANKDQNLSVAIKDMGAAALGLTSGHVGYQTTATSTGLANGTYKVTEQVDGTATSYKLTDDKNNVVATSGNGTLWTNVETSAGFTFADTVIDGTMTVSSGTATATAKVAQSLIDGKNALAAGTYTVSNSALGTAQAGTTNTLYAVTDSDNKVVGYYNSVDGVVHDSFTFNGTGSAATFASAKTLADFSSTAALNGKSFSVGGADVTSAKNANVTLEVLDKAIESVSSQRADLGAVQNRLEHTINNLGVASENLAASESRIRDTDMASEMMKFTRAQILSQAGTSMLSQANQLPQGVLGLLR